MLLIAHRGYHAAAPENTLAAFEAAIMVGASGIETDVRISRDGVPVLIHDRVIASGETVADLTRTEIEQAVGHEIPTLDEALECFPGVLWNVEIKTIQALSTVIKVLEKHQAGHRIIVTSFRHDLVALCASSLKVNCGLLLAHRPLTLNSLLADFNCNGNPRINHVVWNYEVLDDILLKQAASDGYRNFVYGAVTRAEHDNCRELGVDGIITDYPLLVQDA
ncbi:glycerophosphoryl diester phosphodiesterase [Nitrosospira sp. Nsp14]|jgi:glycerophosphoryl diester phosphodiesterase|uniref:glycerophosphodiester phosphodiesterase n=1 Tax=Nitrosospira sp. Nsp14 TaxID=1855333 RepID=UPI0008E35AA7|nr:glycerophosphodiester phosphodiesterase [Nitrosospira sp. Nsp14]SFH22754.1 glycerophosphoryl diester phosphodiesterase [Nitrosospira sp. Nsp14]